MTSDDRPSEARARPQEPKSEDCIFIELQHFDPHVAPHRDVWVTAEEVPQWREAWTNTDIHRSWRMYAQRGNLYGYCRPVLAFEIGDNVDIRIAQKMALKLIDKCYDIFGVEHDSWSIIYSGRRSFHLWQEQALFNVKPMPSHLIALAMKELARRLARTHKVDIDPKIYMATGTLRLPNSRHPKTKLFAIPITYPELKTLSIEQIQALAVEPRKIPTGEGGPSRELTSLFRDIVQTVQNQEAFFELEGRHTDQVLPDEATPECIKAVAAGINEGERHWAAIALASWLHRMRKLDPSQVELEVKKWNNEKNHPPMEPSEVEAIIKDVLNDKVRGSCGNESQAKRCVHDECWIYVGKAPPGAKGKGGKKKPGFKRTELPKISDELWKELVEEFTVGKDEESECPTLVARPFYYFADGSVAREILDGKTPRFALFNPVTDEIVIVNHVKGDLGETVIPVWDGFIGPRLGIALPEKPEDYGDATSLFNGLLEFVLKYYDPVDAEGLAEVKLCILYCMLTGFQDQNINYWPIVNHRGASETGKGTLAFQMYLICDRGMWQVHPSIGTLHRDVNLWRPTLVIDEGDMTKTDAANEMIQFYNARATGAVFSRYNTDTKGSQISEVTGPTIICTRKGFEDDGMESRSLIITGKQGRNMGRNKDGKEGVPYLVPPKALEEARKLRNKLLTFWFKNHDKYEIDYYGSFDGPITPRFQATTLELMGMARKIGLEDIVLATTTEMSRRVVVQRGETTEGRIVRALHSLWTDPDVGRKTPSESSKYLSAEGYYGLIAFKKGENGREENVTEEDVSAKELAEIAHRRFGLHAYKETDKPMAASAVGRHLANLGIKTDQKKIGGERVRHLVLLKAEDLEYLCRKFVQGYEMGQVYDGSSVSSTLDGFDKKRKRPSDEVSAPQSNYSPEKVAAVATVAGRTEGDPPSISRRDESAGGGDDDDFSGETPLTPATPATEDDTARGDAKERGGHTPYVSATNATPATATPATEDGKHSKMTERQTPPLSEFKLPKEIVLAYRRVPVQEDLKDWAVTRKHFAMVNGDPYGPHKARKDAPDAYPALPQEIASLCDFNWHDIERVAGYLHDHKVDVAAALEIMHKSTEATR